MSNDKDPSSKQDFMSKGIDLTIRIAILAIIVFSCFQIFRPFLMPVVWAVIIAVALYPVFLKLKKLVGARNRLAGVIFILVSLAIIVVPTWMLAGSLIDGTVRLGRELQAGTFVVDPPPERVKTWPVVGERLYAIWDDASVNMVTVLRKFEPQIKVLGGRLVRIFTDLGVAVLQTIVALVIAGVLMMNSGGAGRLSRAIGKRLAGEKGVEMVEISGATIQSVVKGVVLIALIQSLLAGIGMVAMQVPFAGLWALLVLIVAVVQLPPWLILLPVIVYVFSVSDNTVANVIFAVYTLIVSGADGFLKPLFLGRGVDVPMLVILIGAIGGLIAAGVVGLFVGAVVLAVGHKLFTAWVGASQTEEVAAIETESKSG